MGNEKILVTGGAGFIGSNLVHHLVNHSGYRVVNLDKLTYAGNLESLADLRGDDRHIFIHGDIGDRNLVARLLREHRPVVIFNLAAESHVDRSIVDAAAFLQTNVVGTYHLLEEARQYWSELDGEDKEKFRFIHISTDEVYGSLEETGKFTEESRIQPNSPYSASKAASDHFVRAYFHTYGLPAVTTNCSNNYGPYQFPEKLIPLMIDHAIEGQPLPVYGDGRNIRDWIYVEDHCTALEQVWLHGRPGEVYNIGGNDEQRNIEIVNQVCDALEEFLPARSNLKITGKGLKGYPDLITYVPDRPGHDRRYAIDATRVEKEIGWQPQVKFTEGLRRTIRWYLDHPDWVEHVRSGAYMDWIKTNYSWRLEEKQ